MPALLAVLLAPLLAALLAACSPAPAPAGADDALDVPTSGELSDCDPVAPSLCGLPFPSTFYMRVDEARPTGWRVHIGATTLPTRTDGSRIDPAPYNVRDGWSPLTPVYAHFPGVSTTGLVSKDDIGAYQNADTRTIIVNVATGERVPHFVELDATSGDDARRLLILHPVAPMAFGQRYAVGLRGLVDDSGNAIAASDAFVALREGTPTSSWDIEGRRDTYDDVVFPALEAAGFSRSELTLAWDFVVASRQGITGKAVAMRDDALARIGADGPAYAVTSVESDVNEHVALRIEGTMTAPLYTAEDAPGTTLTVGADGLPTYNGDTVVKFVVVVPRTLVDNPRPGALVQIGHGLLGSRADIDEAWVGQMADAWGWVAFASDWTGMSSKDESAIYTMLLGGLNRFEIIPERSQQGFVEMLCVNRMMAGTFAHDPLMQGIAASSGEPVSFIDPTRRYFYGNSQGSILGGAYVALSPDIQRAVLGVPGAPFNLILPRSEDFKSFFNALSSVYLDPAARVLWIGLTQTLWDSGESAGYATAIAADPLEGSPAKQVLLQAGIGDAYVTTLAAHVVARSVGARLVGAPARAVWGLETVESGWTGSALTEFDYGVAEPETGVPVAESLWIHGQVRNEPTGQEQAGRFLEDGVVMDTCGGPCMGTQGE